jgi:hypothetical protein
MLIEAREVVAFTLPKKFFMFPESSTVRSMSAVLEAAKTSCIPGAVVFETRLTSKESAGVCSICPLSLNMYWIIGELGDSDDANHPPETGAAETSRRRGTCPLCDGEVKGTDVVAAVSVGPGAFPNGKSELKKEFPFRPVPAEDWPKSETYPRTRITIITMPDTKMTRPRGMDFMFRNASSEENQSPSNNRTRLMQGTQSHRNRFGLRAYL